MRYLLATLFVIVVGVTTATAQTPFASLKAELEKIIAASAAEKVGVALYGYQAKLSAQRT